MYSIHLTFEERTKLGRYLVVRYEQSVFVGERNKVTVEEPVDRPRQRNPVLHNVRAAFAYAPNMGGLHFRPAASVDDLEAGHRAAVVIGLADVATKVGVADLAVHEHLFDAARLIRPGH